jgi:hypothetical protein
MTPHGDEVLDLPTVGYMHTIGPIFVHKTHTRGVDRSESRFSRPRLGRLV